MKLAIADPPYLGRANRYYGTGRGHAGGVGRADHHPEAALWDRIDTHVELVRTLAEDYDGWALACMPDSLRHLLPVCPPDVRVAVWHKTNPRPTGSYVTTAWEPVLVQVPRNRRGRGERTSTRDVLSAPVPHVRFVGAKPPEWTRWVLALLGFDPVVDELVDLFPGSGAVTSTSAGMLL